MTPPRRLRIAIGGVQHETNSFVPGLTDIAAFEHSAMLGPLLRGEALNALRGESWCLSGLMDAAGSEVELLPTLFAYADEGAPVARTAVARLCNELGERLRAAGQADAVVLELHGAMLDENGRDGDAAVLAAARAAVGPDVPIVVTVDMHANITEEMVRLSDAIIGFRTYPHVDQRDIGVRALRAARLMAGKPRRPQQLRMLPFILPLSQQCTLDGLGAELYRALEEVEQQFPDLAALTLTMGFQQADIVHPGPAIVAAGPGADAAADLLYAACAAREADCRFSYLDVPAAVAAAAARPAGSRPLVLADAQDNPGGGSSGDSMAAARVLAEAGLAAVVAMITDADTVGKAHAAGIGATIRCDVGGRRLTGDRPLSGEFRVEALGCGPLQLQGPMMQGLKVDPGRTCRLRTGALDLLLCEHPMQCLDQVFFRHLGVDPDRTAVLVVKSAVHFRAGFPGTDFDHIDMIGPGQEVIDITELPYKIVSADLRFCGRRLGGA